PDEFCNGKGPDVEPTGPGGVASLQLSTDGDRSQHGAETGSILGHLRRLFSGVGCEVSATRQRSGEEARRFRLRCRTLARFATSRSPTSSVVPCRSFQCFRPPGDLTGKLLASFGPVGEGGFPL